MHEAAIQRAELAMPIVDEDPLDQVQHRIARAFQHLHEVVADDHQHAGDTGLAVAPGEVAAHHVQLGDIERAREAAHVHMGGQHDRFPVTFEDDGTQGS